MDNAQLLHFLSDKLQNANKTVIMEKRRQKQEIEQKLQNIQAIFQSKKKFQSDLLQKTKYSTDKVTSLTSEIVKNLNIKVRKEEELVRELKEHVQNDFQAHERQHQQRCEYILDRSKDKMAQIIDDLTKKAKNISVSNQKCLIEVKKAINNLQKDLNDEVEQRRNNSRQIQEDIANEVTKFNNIIQKEREHRLESQQKIQCMVGEIRTKITSQIESLNTKRKRNNAAILKLIEGACERLEDKINPV